MFFLNIIYKHIKILRVFHKKYQKKVRSVYFYLFKKKFYLKRVRIRIRKKNRKQRLWLLSKRRKYIKLSRFVYLVKSRK